MTRWRSRSYASCGRIQADSYLGALLWRIDNARIVSGMGERPAIAHLKDFKLAGMTTGSDASRRARAERSTTRAAGAADHRGALRHFMPPRITRRAGPARVLHHATECAGIAPTGPIPPYISPLAGGHLSTIAPVARALKERDSQ